jgi:putative ABC transport system substrate-binding protein
MRLIGLAVVLALSLSLAPLVAETQQAGKAHHVGFLPAGLSSAHRQQFEALREGLRELGYVEGKTIVITALWPKTPSELPELAASLVKHDVELN